MTAPATLDAPDDEVLDGRDLAVLRAVAAGRCGLGRDGLSLAVDGVCCCDQFVGARLKAHGLITDAAALTAAGRHLLDHA